MGLKNVDSRHNLEQNEAGETLNGGGEIHDLNDFRPAVFPMAVYLPHPLQIYSPTPPP